MKINVKYEGNNENQEPVSMVLDIPDGDYSVMLELDYQQRLEEAPAEKKNEVKKCETVQDVFDIMNKREYNIWHKEHRRRGQIQTPFRRDDETEDESDGMETVPDNSDEINRTARYEYDAVCQRIRQALGKKQDWADMFIAVRIDSIPIREYAASIGANENNITQKLKRAEKKLRVFFQNRQI